MPDNKVTMTAGETTTVLLTGGSGQYAATATEEVKGLNVSQPIPLGEAVRITTTTETPATDTSVWVKDVAGQSAIIELTVTATHKTANNTPVPPAIVTPPTFEMSLGRGEVRQIQTALRICNDPSDLKVDGILGPDTRAAASNCVPTLSTGDSSYNNGSTRHLDGHPHNFSGTASLR